MKQRGKSLQMHSIAGIPLVNAPLFEQEHAVITVLRDVA